MSQRMTELWLRPVLMLVLKGSSHTFCRGERCESINYLLHKSRFSWFHVNRLGTKALKHNEPREHTCLLGSASSTDLHTVSISLLNSEFAETVFSHSTFSSSSEQMFSSLPPSIMHSSFFLENPKHTCIQSAPSPNAQASTYFKPSQPHLLHPNCDHKTYKI